MPSSPASIRPHDDEHAGPAGAYTVLTYAGTFCVHDVTAVQAELAVIEYLGYGDACGLVAGVLAGRHVELINGPTIDLPVVGELDEIREMYDRYERTDPIDVADYRSRMLELTVAAAQAEYPPGSDAADAAEQIRQLHDGYERDSSGAIDHDAYAWQIVELGLQLAGVDR